MGKNMVRAILCGVVLLICCQWVQAHGFLSVPPARNFIANKKGQEYCHHCLSAGGPSTCQSLTPGGLYPSPTETTRSAVRSNLCGEAANLPASSRKYNPSPVPVLSALPVFQAGQEFDMEITITVHHRGHYEFRVCDASTLSDPTTVTWECLSQNLLERVSVPGEISPVDVNHPERYYLEPECAPGYSNVNKMRYKMPDTLNCERCVLQWWWITGNTCNPPDYANRSPQPAHVANGCNWWQSNLPICSVAYPEEFWNCADIRVNGTGQSTGPVQPASGNNQPKPVSAPVAVASPKVPEVAPQAPPPAVPQTPGQCRPCTRDDGAQCTHAGAASVTWCNSNCPAGVNDAWCPATHCTCVAPSETPAVVPPAVPQAPPPAQPVAPPPAQPVAPPPTKPLAPPPAKPVPPPPAQSSNCVALGWQCGGQGWGGSNCCSQGECMAYIYSYSQCRNDCPPGWLCNSSEKSLLTQAVDAIKNLF